MRKLMAEPLVQFALGGAMLFGIYTASVPGDDRVIRVPAHAVDALVRQRAELLGRDLTEGERRRVIDEHIDSEVLVREAYRRGLDQADQRIKRQLVVKMRLLMDDPPGDPSDEQLRAYLDKNRERYETGEVRAVEHVFFRSPPPEPDGVLGDLRAEAPHELLGEGFWLGPRLEYSRFNLAQSFGVEFADSVFGTVIGEWTGPVRSTAGIHFVRVVDVLEPPAPSFAQLAPALRTDWFETTRIASLSERIAALREGYTIQFGGQAARSNK